MDLGLNVPHMPSTALGRVLRGFGSNAFSQLISAGTSFLLVPLFLHSWGAVRYGHWLILTSLVTYLTLVDLGGQNYFGNLLAAAYAKKDFKTFSERIAEGFSLYLLISIFAFCLLVGTCLLPPNTLFHHIHAFDLEDKVVLLCMGSAFLLGVPFGIVSAAYRACGLYAHATMIGNINRGTTLLISMALLLGGAGPGSYAFIWLISNLMLVAYMALDLPKRVPAARGLRIGIRQARRGLVHLPGSLYFWLLTISNALNQQGVLLVLAAYGSPVGVALYATHKTVCGLVTYVGTFVQSPLLPEMNFLFTRDEKDKLRRTSLLAIKAVTLTATCAGIGLWLILPVVYPRWTGRSLRFDPFLLAILLTQVILSAGWLSSGWILMASNQHRRISVASLANGLLTVALCIPMAARWGVHGVAAASLVGDLVCGVAVYPVLASSVLGLSKVTLYRTILFPLLAVTPLWMVAFGAPVAHSFSLFSNVLLTLLCLLLLLPAAISGFWRHEDNTWIRDRIRSFAI